jgi:hypothetical protein
VVVEVVSCLFETHLFDFDVFGLLVSSLLGVAGKISVRRIPRCGCAVEV